MFKEKHKKMSLDVPRHPYHLIIYHSSSIGWVGLSDVIQIKQYCLQKLKTAYNLQVWQAVKHHFKATKRILMAKKIFLKLKFLTYLFFLLFAFPSFLRHLYYIIFSLFSSRYCCLSLWQHYITYMHEEMQRNYILYVKIQTTKKGPLGSNTLANNIFKNSEKRMNSGQMIVVQVIWKCLYMTGGMKHVWLISDDEDLDDEVDDGAEDEDLCKLALYTALGGFDPSKWLGSKTLVTTTSSINPFSQIKILEMSIQIKLRSYPTSISMFKEKHKKMSLDVPRHPYHLIIYHSSSIGWVGLSDVIQIKQYCLQKLKTAYNLQVWQAVKHKTHTTNIGLWAKKIFLKLKFLTYLFFLLFAFPSFLRQPLKILLQRSFVDHQKQLASKTFWKEV
ncbi:hypothetical protein ACJX0J_023922, partial [Zea mays]